MELNKIENSSFDHFSSALFNIWKLGIHGSGYKQLCQSPIFEFKIVTLFNADNCYCDKQLLINNFSDYLRDEQSVEKLISKS